MCAKPNKQMEVQPQNALEEVEQPISEVKRKKQFWWVVFWAIVPIGVLYGLSMLIERCRGY